MPSTTTRGFRYPLIDRSETPDVPRDFKNLADDIDAQYIAVANSGSLPSFGKVGRRARAVDSGIVWLDIGTAWVKEIFPAGATPWEDVSTWGIAWPASFGSGTFWASGARSSPAANWSTVPDIFMYKTADTPTGFTAEFRICVAYYVNTTPNSQWSANVQPIVASAVNTSANIPLNGPVSGSPTVGTGTQAANASGDKGIIQTTPVAASSFVDNTMYGAAMNMASAPAANSFMLVNIKLQRRWK
jgi:hypothetical protein